LIHFALLLPKRRPDPEANRSIPAHDPAQFTRIIASESGSLFAREQSLDHFDPGGVEFAGAAYWRLRGRAAHTAYGKERASWLKGMVRPAGGALPLAPHPGTSTAGR
jgi:hypothetical protein